VRIAGRGRDVRGAQLIPQVTREAREPLAALRFGGDKRALYPRLRFTPHRLTVIHRVTHDKNFVAHFEGRIAYATLLTGFGQG